MVNISLVLTLPCILGTAAAPVSILSHKFPFYQLLTLSRLWKYCSCIIFWYWNKWILLPVQPSPPQLQTIHLLKHQHQSLSFCLSAPSGFLGIPSQKACRETIVWCTKDATRHVTLACTHLQLVVPVLAWERAVKPCHVFMVHSQQILFSCL